jgi:hypothetical protein
MCAARRERRCKWRNIVLTAGLGCVGLDSPLSYSHLLHFLLPDLFVGPSPFPAREQLLLPRKNPVKKPPKETQELSAEGSGEAAIWIPDLSLIPWTHDTVSLRLLGFPIVQATSWTFSDTKYCSYVAVRREAPGALSGAYNGLSFCTLFVLCLELCSCILHVLTVGFSMFWQWWNNQERKYRICPVRFACSAGPKAVLNPRSLNKNINQTLMFCCHRAVVNPLLSIQNQDS